MEMKFIRIGLMAFVAFSFCSACRADGLAGKNGELVVAVRGRPVACRVVVPADGTPCHRNAAEEFVNWAEKVSGVRLAIVTDAEPLPEQAIVLGPTKYTKALLGDDAGEAYPESAFRLKLNGGRLVVAAGTDQAVLYGVYEILQRYGKVEFYTPEISVTPPGDIVIPAGLNEFVKPSVAYRDISCRRSFADADAAARFRFNGTHVGRKGNGDLRWGTETCALKWHGKFRHCHSFNAIASKKEFGETHPEYFLKDTNGVPRLNHSRREAQLCLTNPDVVRLGKERLAEALKSSPDKKWFGISQEDTQSWCCCKDCRAIDDAEGGASATLVTYLNAMADEMAKIRPDARLTTLAYHQTRNPPKTLKLRDNVLVGLCVTECDFSRPLVSNPNEGNRTFLDAITKWSRISGGVWIWDYCTDYDWFPMAMPDVGALAGNIRLYADNNVSYVYESGDGCPYSFFFDLKAYVISKMLWDAHQPLEPLVDGFMKGCYGPAADEVRAVFDLFEKHDYDRTTLRMGYALDATNTNMFQTVLFDRAAQHWKRATELVGTTEPYASMVRRGRIGNDSVRLIRYCYSLACREKPATDTPEYKAEMLAVAKEFMAIEDARVAAAKKDEDGKVKAPWTWGWAMDGRACHYPLIKAFLEGKKMPKRVRGKWVKGSRTI